MWTRFMDMYSGGRTKVEIDGQAKDSIYIELPEDDALQFFERKFGHHPYEVACECCGQNYSVSEYETLEAATSYERTGYRTKIKISVEEYLKNDGVLIIYNEYTRD